MPRYLQKLVARAGVSPFPSSLQPAFRAGGAEFGGPDALPEVLEPSLPDAPALPDVSVSLANVEGASAKALEHSIEIRHQAIPPAPQPVERHVEPQSFSRKSTPPEEKRQADVRIEPTQPLEMPPLAPVLPPAMAQESPPAVTILSQPDRRETVPPQTDASPVPATQKPHAERNVLSQLMPQLEAWFKQPSPEETKAENPAPNVHLAPTLRRPEPSTESPPDEPRLVIGQIRVDVLPAPTSPPFLQVVRIPARSAQSPAMAGMIAKLGFGLGQM